MEKYYNPRAPMTQSCNTRLIPVNGPVQIM